MVLHDLVHSSSFHQDFVGGAQVSFLLAFRSAINSPNSFEVEFCIFFVLLSYPIISVCGRLIPYDLETLPIRPQQAYSFIVDFLNNSVQPFPSKFLSFHSFNSSGGFALFISSSAIPSSEVHVLFLPFLAGVLPKFFQSYSFLISF